MSDPISLFLGKLQEVVNELHNVAKHLGSGGEKNGDSQGFNVGLGAPGYTQLLGENPRRTKLNILNADPGGGNPFEFFYTPAKTFGNGFRLTANGGAYTDDSFRCYKGPIYARIDPTLPAATTVAVRAGEEWR